MDSQQGTNRIRPEMQAQRAQKQLLEQAKAYAYDYLDQVGERHVYPTDSALKNLAVFDESLPEQPQDAAAIIRLLHEYGSPATVAQGGGRYFGFVNGNILPVTLAARWLADTWDQNVGLYVISPIASQLEAICEKWLVELFGLPTGTVAGFVSGTSTATLCGLAAGRNTILKNHGWDVNTNGLFGAPPIRVVMSEEAHGTVKKALAVLGIGQNNIEYVPADAQGRMDADQMPELDAQTLLILQAGNVNSGAFDAFPILCERARKANAWVHIDGAFGLWAAASSTKKALTAGIELADSWSVDGHKTLNAPYDNGIVLCRNQEALVTTLHLAGAYIQYSDHRDSMLYTPEMSRRARGVDIWAALKYLGRSGVGELVDGLCDRAVQFADQLHAENFRILNDVIFNQVVVACDTPEETNATLQAIQRSGECWCGGSTWKGEPVIRISVCSWATTPEDVNRSVAAFVQARAAVAN